MEVKELKEMILLDFFDWSNSSYQLNLEFYNSVLLLLWSPGEMHLDNNEKEFCYLKIRKSPSSPCLRSFHLPINQSKRRAADLNNRLDSQ